MFAAATPILTLLAAAIIYVRADPNPTNPGPGDVFTVGQSCSTGWDPDASGLWKTMNIELMTGDNFNMVPLTLVATVDGTNPSKTTFSYPCPNVTPYSTIYFYQFSSPSTENKTWTGRFAITDSSQHLVTPSNPTQPDGESIPWGTGALVNGSSSAVPTASGAPGTNGASGVLSPSASLTLGPSLPSTPTSDASPSSVISSALTPSTVSSKAANGAAATLSASHVLSQTALALGFAALGFAVMC